MADWLGYPRALLFISGFAANQAVIAALAGKEDRIVADRLSHASLLEAASLSPAQLRRFQHNDSRHLDDLLAKPLSGQQLVVTEGILAWTAIARRWLRFLRRRGRPARFCWLTTRTVSARSAKRARQLLRAAGTPGSAYRHLR